MPKIRNVYPFSLLIVVCWLMGMTTAHAQISISADTVLQTSTCPGGQLIINYSVSGGSLNFGTPLQVEWSDGFGSFDSPEVITNTIHTGIGIILSNIPQSATIGFNYRVRIVSQNPPVTSSASGLPIIVTAFQGLADIEVSPQNIVCGAGEVELSAGFGAGNYRWNTGETTQWILAEETGTYSVTVSDLLGLCTYESDRIFVGINPDPQDPTITPIGNVLVSSEAESYQWYIDGEAVPGATERRFRPQKQYGMCQIEATDEAGCITRSNLFNLDDLDNIQAFPNPVVDMLTVDVGYIENGDYYWKLFDSEGNWVAGTEEKTGVTGDVIQEIDMTGMAPGLYILQVLAKGGVRSFRIQKIE